MGKSGWCKIERFGGRFKLTLFKTARISAPIPERTFVPNNCVDNADDITEKLSQSVSRARSRVLELALCNPWDYFVTFTLSAEKYDRYDLKKFVKDLGVCIGNYNKTNGCSLKYILVPEQHLDGAWHMHGLLRGVAPDTLVLNQFGYFDIPYFSAKFGFVSLSKVRDHNRVAGYITKYVSKDLSARKSEYGAHLFYSSNGLLGKEVISMEFQEADNLDYENDYVGIAWGDRISDFCLSVPSSHAVLKPDAPSDSSSSLQFSESEFVFSNA